MMPPAKDWMKAIRFMTHLSHRYTARTKNEPNIWPTALQACQRIAHSQCLLTESKLDWLCQLWKAHPCHRTDLRTDQKYHNESYLKRREIIVSALYFIVYVFVYVWQRAFNILRPKSMLSNSGDICESRLFVEISVSTKFDTICEISLHMCISRNVLFIYSEICI